MLLAQGVAGAAGMYGGQKVAEAVYGRDLVNRVLARDDAKHAAERQYIANVVGPYVPQPVKNAYNTVTNVAGNLAQGARNVVSRVVSPPVYGQHGPGMARARGTYVPPAQAGLGTPEEKARERFLYEARQRRLAAQKKPKPKVAKK